ncbi:MAG: hypothetical protein R2797_12045 [Gelidibacter sp.]
MKLKLLILFLLFNLHSIAQSNSEINDKAYIESDSIIWVPQNINSDYKIFGYKNKDSLSEKLILISVFTKDVENNPYDCKYGAYYHTQGMDGLKLKYISTEGDFVKTAIIKNGLIVDKVYMESRWFEFEEKKDNFQFVATKKFVELKLPDSLEVIPNKNLIADFNGDLKPDVATLVKNKRNSKIGVLIVNHSNHKMFVFGAGKEVDNMTDLKWIEVFKTMPKGEIVSPTLVDEETGDIIGQDESKNFKLIGNGIYMSAEESHGGVIIFWNGKEYQWYHIE